MDLGKHELRQYETNEKARGKNDKTEEMKMQEKLRRECRVVFLACGSEIEAQAKVPRAPLYAPTMRWSGIKAINLYASPQPNIQTVHYRK